MSEPGMIWEAEPHTLAKHRILTTYLQAWVAILSSQTAKLRSRRSAIRYIDAFAGPGIYRGEQPGSPILALRSVIEHERTLPTPVEFTFIEFDEQRCASLQREITKLQDHIRQSKNIAEVRVRQGDAKEIIPILIREADGHAFGPAMFFLDQFGYAEVPIALVRQILMLPMCEVFSYLNWNQLNRFMGDEHKARGLTAAFGSDAWRSCIPLPREKRDREFLRLYKAALRQHGGAKYVLDFAMYGEHDTLLNWLVFCTNNVRGLEQMKRAMSKVGEKGTFRFSDKTDPSQLLLASESTDEWLARELSKRLGGRKMTVQDVKEYVLLETPNYAFKEALRILEQAGLLKVPSPTPGRRRLQFPDEHMEIEFLPQDSESGAREPGDDGLLFS